MAHHPSKRRSHTGGICQVKPTGGQVFSHPLPVEFFCTLQKTAPVLENSTTKTHRAIGTQISQPQSACRSECRWARQCGFKKPSKQASSPKACTTSTAMTTATLKVAAPCQRRTLQRPGRNQGWSSSCAAISGRGGEAECLAVKVLFMISCRRFTFACFHFMQARSSTHHGRKGLTRRTIKTTRRSNTENTMKKGNCDASFAWHRMLSVARSSVPHAPRYVKHAMCRCMSDTVMKSITIPTPAGSWI